MATSHYSLRPRKSKTAVKETKSAKSRAFNTKVKIKQKLLKRYAPPKPPKKKIKPKCNGSDEEKESSKKGKKNCYAEPVAIRAVYWVPPTKQGNDFLTNISWYNLPGHYGFSISELLNGKDCWELSNECQLRNGDYKQFKSWYQSRARMTPQKVIINNIVYDVYDNKYFMVNSLPTNDQRYVWEGYDNYVVGFGREFDPYTKIIGAGEGIVCDTQYSLYSEEIIVVEKLEWFYFKQLSMNQLYHAFEQGMTRKFQRNMKAKPLSFYESVLGNTWDHYIKKELDDNEIEYEDTLVRKAWTMSLEEAEKVFPKNSGSHFKKEYGVKRYFVDDMDFILYVRKNKLRIYSVIWNENIQTGALNGSDIDKKCLRRSR